MQGAEKNIYFLSRIHLTARHFVMYPKQCKAKTTYFLNNKLVLTIHFAYYKHSYSFLDCKNNAHLSNYLKVHFMTEITFKIQLHLMSEIATAIHYWFWKGTESGNITLCFDILWLDLIFDVLAHLNIHYCIGPLYFCSHQMYYIEI